MSRMRRSRPAPSMAPASISERGIDLQRRQEEDEVVADHFQR